MPSASFGQEHRDQQMDQVVETALAVRPTTHASIQILSSKPSRIPSLMVNRDIDDYAEAREPSVAEL